MIDVDGTARDAARGVRDSAAKVEPPRIASVRSSRRTRAWVAVAAGAFLLTLFAVGSVALTRGSVWDVAGSSRAPSLPGEPDGVRAREPFFYCGAVLGGGFGDNGPKGIDLDYSETAADCFFARLDAGLQAEVIRVGVTIEGDAIIYIYRGWVGDVIEVFEDTTRDAFGPQRWYRYTCTQYAPVDRVFGIAFDGCSLPRPIG